MSEFATVCLKLIAEHFICSNILIFILIDHFRSKIPGETKHHSEKQTETVDMFSLPKLTFSW